MGSWSTTIMGSDDALDARDGIFGMCGITEASTCEQTKKALESLTPQQWSSFVAQGGDRRYTEVKKMVGAVLFMACGAHLPPSLSDEAIRAARGENLAGEGWRDMEGRRFHLDQLVNALLSYDGTPTNVDEESLGQAWQRNKPGKPRGM